MKQTRRTSKPKDPPKRTYLDPTLREQVRLAQTFDAGPSHLEGYCTVAWAARYLHVSTVTINNLRAMAWEDGAPRLVTAPRDLWPNGKCVLLTTASVEAYARRRRFDRRWHVSTTPRAQADKENLQDTNCIIAPEAHAASTEARHE